MNGLIRGKRLVWVRDANCWRAESQFGVYYAHQSTMPNKYHWDLSTIGDDETLNEGQADTLELGQAACQADHDQRAMASVAVVPFEWSDGEQGWSHATHGTGSLAVSLVVFPIGAGDRHRWEASINNSRLDFGSRATKAEAITAAETFVRQLVMGVQ